MSALLPANWATENKGQVHATQRVDSVLKFIRVMSVTAAEQASCANRMKIHKVGGYEAAIEHRRISVTGQYSIFLLMWVPDGSLARGLLEAA
jgi:hypothetical protein